MDETLGTGIVEPIGESESCGQVQRSRRRVRSSPGSGAMERSGLKQWGELAYMATVNLRNGVHKHRHPEPVLWL